LADYTLRGIDDGLWRSVKSLAALKGVTIKDLIIELLKEAVKKQDNK